MADFYVPLATNTLTSIDSLIANAPGAMKVGEAIGNLPDAYWAGQNQAYQQRNRNLFQQGIPADIGGELLKAAGASGVPEYVALQKLKLGQDIAGGMPAPSYPPTAGTGYTPPPAESETGPPSSAVSVRPQAQVTLRQVAAQNGIDPVSLGHAVGMSPEDPVDMATQRGLLVDAARNLKAAPTGPPPPAAPQPGVQVAQTFNDLNQPQPTGAMVGARPVRTVPVTRPQAAQATQAFTPDVQARQQEMTAARAEYTANVMRQRAQAAAAIGDDALSRQLGAQADFYQGQASDIRKSLLGRYEPTGTEKEARNPAVRGAAVAKEADAADVKAYQASTNSAQQLAQVAPMGLQRIDEMQSLTTQPNFYSGPFAKGMQTYQQFRSLFGHDPQAATAMEAFNKGANDLALDQIRGLAKSGVGRVLLAEVNSIRKATASSDISPSGNRFQLETLRRVYQQQQAFGDIANQVSDAVSAGRVSPGNYASTLNRAIDEYTRSHPPFTADEKAHPLLLGAVAGPPNMTQMPLAQVRAWEAQSGVRPGDPLRVNGSYIKAP